MKVLWLIPKWTLPVTDGARVATDSLIRNTIACGAQVDVVCLAGPGEDCDIEAMKSAWSVNEVHVFHRRIPTSRFLKYLYYVSSLLQRPFLPLTFSSFADTHIQKSLRKLLDQNKYDRMVLDGLHLGTPFLKGNALRRHPNVSRIVYRAHNIEAELWKKKAQEKTTHPVLRFLLQLQGHLVEKIEKKILIGADGVAAIAQEDLEVVKDMLPEKNARLVPLGMNFETSPAHTEKGPVRFLFIGRLDWAPNKDGLEWMLNEVWPEVVKVRQGAVLKVVGSGNGDWLQKYSGLPGLLIKGFVKEINDAYEDCHFTIVPIHYGSGTRIKVIESFVMNRRLISTGAGVQGANLRNHDYVQAETARDWIRVLCTIDFDENQKELLEDSRKYMMKQFGEKQVGRDFYDWMRTF